MSQTPRFKLSYFGGGAQGGIADDGMKYTSADRMLIDRLLSQAEEHDHRYRPVAVGQLPAPTLEVLTDAGSLPGGSDLFYRIAIVDAQGNESLASFEVGASTPDAVAVPTELALVETAGASTLSGSYYYALSALRGTEQSPLGPSTLIGVFGTAVTISTPVVAGVDQHRVWRMGINEAYFTAIGTMPSGGSFVDDGSVPSDPCASDPSKQPPLSGIGSRRYAVRVTLPDEAAALLDTARSWRIYRTNTPGAYPSATLVHDTVERTDEWDETAPLVDSWIDTGGPLVTGRPMLENLNMRFKPYAFDSATVLPTDPMPYPEGYPILVDGTLYVATAGEWVAVTSGGGGGGGEVAGLSPIMTSPNGSRFILGVDDSGVLTTTPTTFPGPPAPVTGIEVV